MGRYINEIDNKTVPIKGKVRFILDNVPGSKVVTLPDKWEEGLVCVIDNGNFEAAVYAYDHIELERFSRVGDNRPRTWMIVPNAKNYAEL